MTILNRSISNLVAGLVAALALLIAASSPVAAASSQVQFNGVVPAHSQSGSIQNYPQTIVSFSESAALPIEALIRISSDVRVFDEAGNRIANSTTATLPVDGRATKAQLVPLGSADARTFIVCAGSRKHCLRYQVIRH